jgi:quercetin dioxygenase-like cupin family protein
MTRLIDTQAQAWQPVRPELTSGVSGLLLLDGPVRMVLTRVAPGGIFRLHRDQYGHLFHLLAGAGRFRVEGEEYPLGAGMVLQLQAGELHGYENSGEEDLLLLSVNLPAG